MSRTTEALLLIQEIRAALQRGTRHYHPVTGEWLKTEKEILDTLCAEGSIEFESVRSTNIG